MPVFLYPPMLEVRAIVARFDRTMAEGPPFVVPRGEPLEDRARIAETMRDLFTRFDRRRQHTTRHGGDRVLRRAAPAIAPAVDAGNHAARASGFPVAVVDLDRLRGELRISTTPGGLRMLDEGGRSRDVGKLPCVVDDLGPCVTPVALRHDARVTAATTTTLSIMWGHDHYAAALDATAHEHRTHLEQLGARCEALDLVGPGDDPVGRSLLQQVLDDPSDDHARLVFADWLDTFDIACHHRRARLIRESLVGEILLEILDSVASDIDNPVATWERGFVGRIDLADLAYTLTPVLYREPVEVARVHALHDALPASVWDIAVWQPELGPVPHRDPQRIRKLQASGKPGDDFWPWLGTLSALTWLSLRVDTDCRVQLPPLPAVRTLIVERGRCAASRLAALAPTIESLHLNSVEIDGKFPRLPRLAKLALYRMAIESLEPFIGLPLRELHLDVRSLTRLDVARILSFESLEVLGVHGDPDIENAVSRAIDEGALPNLREVYGLYPSRRELRPR